MELSYDEILRLLERMGRKPDGFVHRGVTDYVGAAKQPRRRAGGGRPDRARAGRTPGRPALRRRDRRDQQRRLGAAQGAGHHRPGGGGLARAAMRWNGRTPASSTCKQDVGGAQVLFDCGVPVVLLPCMGVVSHLHSTVPEIERHVEPFGEIGKFLAQRYKEYSDNHVGWSKEIWDMAPVAWLIDPDWCPSVLIPTPILTEVPTWSFDARPRR